MSGNLDDDRTQSATNESNPSWDKTRTLSGSNKYHQVYDKNGVLSHGK